jgi:hypothetical protein
LAETSIPSVNLTLRLLLEYRYLRGDGIAVFGGELKKDLHAHGESPRLIIGKRAFQKRRSGKLRPVRHPRSPQLWLI